MDEETLSLITLIASLVVVAGFVLHWLARRRRAGPDNPESGQAVLAGALMLLVLVVVAAGLTDLYTLQTARLWGYRAAEEAALAGVSLGRDWASYPFTGQMRLDPALAWVAADGGVTDALARAGVTAATWQIEVLPDPDGGLVLGFPPVAQANLWGVSDWGCDEPAVGVYLEFPVDTVLMGLVNGNAPVTLHVFAAASVGELN